MFIFLLNRKTMYRKTAAAVLLAFTSINAMAQINYEMSRFTNTYTAISTGGGATQISTTGTGLGDFTNTSGTANADDGAAFIAFPFSFTYNGTSFTTSDFINICSNGFISFYTGTPTNSNKQTSTGNTSLNTTPASVNALAPWWDDLSVASGSVLYQVSGSTPDRKLTIQWTDIPTYLGASKTMSFQVVIYEHGHTTSSNYIEFNYGAVSVSGTKSTSESATIGIKNATGGFNNFIDATTGLKSAVNGMLHSDYWPGNRSFRFIPNSSVTAIAGGTYTAGTSGTYPSITEAIADINHRGISGAVTLNLSNASYTNSSTGGELFPLVLGPISGTSVSNTITIVPTSGRSTITATGASGGNVNFVNSTATSSTAISSTTEPVIALYGCDFITIRNVDLRTATSSTTYTSDIGIAIRNHSATDGATNNTIRDITISLLRNHTSSVGIAGLHNFTPTATSGANSNNKFYNYDISNANNGITYTGASTSFPPLNCEFGVISGGTSIIRDLGSTTSVNGISITTLQDASIFNNIIQDISATSTINGITGSTLMGTTNIYNNIIRSLALNSTTSTVANTGINISSLGTLSVATAANVYNNVITNLTHAYSSTASPTRVVVGIALPASYTGTPAREIRLHYNSVRISGPANATSSCLNINAATGLLNIRNNVFANFTGAQSGTPKHYCVFTSTVSGTTPGSSGTVMNNNCYYIDNASNGFVALTSTTDRTTLSNFAGGSGAFTGIEANGISGTDPGFNSTTNLAPLSGTSVLIAAGNPVTTPSITTDIIGATRSVTTPSIGAYENAGDAQAPTITYTALSNQTTSNFTTSNFATITDNSAGVNTTSGTRPRFYYKKSTDANAFVGNTSSHNGWKWVEANGTSSPFDFTIDWSIINGGSVSLNDVIQYFVVAQDNATTPNVGALPLPGFAGTSVSSITSAPTTPNSFTIVNPPLSGSYNIGASQTAPNYTTITAAMTDLTTRGVSAAVTFNLTDATYSTSETFPITIGTIAGTSSTNTVTIKPATSVNATITGANTGSSIIRLNGTDFFIIDGSNNGTGSRNLTIQNNVNTATSAVIWLASQGTAAGCTNVTIKNCNITLNPTIGSNGTIGILIAGTTISTSGTGADNDDVTIENNSFKAAGYGIVAGGIAGTGELNNLIIKNNSIGSTGSDIIFTRGIDIQNTTTGSKIFGNEIFNLNVNWGASVVAMAGIYMQASTNNTEIYNNKIYDIINVTTGNSTTTGAIGIGTNTSTLHSNISIYNNLIYNLRCHTNSTSVITTGGMYGIRLYGGTNHKVYHNTVYLSGTVTHSSASAASVSACLAIGTTPTTALDVRNNIFVNTMEMPFAGSQSYSIYYNFTTSFTGLTSNNNSLFGSNGPSNTTYNAGYYNSSIQNNFATNWQAAHTAASQETASIGSNPNLNSTSNMVPLTGSPVAGAGTNIAAVTTDYEGTTRNGSTPYIGAYEKAGDFEAPVITYTALTNTGLTTNRTLTVTITDNSTGVPTSGGNVPRIWYRRSLPSTSAWTSAAGTLASGTGTNGTWDFTIDYTALSGSTATGDRYQYYIVAQDQATTPNLAYNPSAGAAHTNVSTQTTPPTTPSTYDIVTPLGTTLSVGTGQTYTSLTGAGGLFEGINNSVLGGNTTVNITSDLSEDGTNQLNGASLNGFTLLIQPSAASLRIISNSADLSQSMIRLIGATGVTIDGRSGGTGQFLRFVNTHATPANCFAAIEINNGSTNNTVRNCIIETNSSATSRGSFLIGNTGTNSGNSLRASIVRDAQGTPGTVGVPAVAVYIGVNAGTTTIGGSTAADGNEVYNFTGVGIVNISTASNQTIQHNKVYQTASRSAATINISMQGGNNHTISNNSMYITSGSYTGVFTGISVIGSTNGHTIANNSIGGGASDRSGNALSSSTTITGILLTVGTTTATSVQGNTFSNIGSTSSPVFGINATSGNINIGTITGNTFGGLANAYDTIRNGTDNGIINYTGTGTVTIENNTIGNVAYYSNSGDRTAGVYISSTATAIIRNNTIRDISANTTTTSFTSTFLLSGIHIASTISASSVIENNTIYNITNTNTGSSAYIAQGIHMVGSASGSIVKRNRIYGINAIGTGTGTSAPNVFGIFTRGGAAAFVNNQISVGNGVGNEVRVYGVYMNGTGDENFYYNSVHVSGTTASGTNRTYAFYRGSLSTLGTKNLVNNIFYNERTGGTGGHFAIGTNSTSGWASVTSNYNLLVSGSASTIGDYAGTAYSFTDWQTTAAKDANSFADVTANLSSSNLFSATASGNLNIATGNSTCWWVNGRGVQITGQTEDYGSASAARSTTLAGGGTDIGSDEFTPGVNPPDVVVSGSHTNSGTETFTFAGRPVASITWGASGTLPTLTGYKYWPGSWPNDVTNNGTVTGATYFNAYWVINASGGSGYTYDLTLNYDDALLGTVSTESNVRMAKKQTGVNGTWTSFNSNTTLNTTANTMTVTGLTDFSEFTGNENSNPLPVEWLSFTGKPTGEHVELSWTTATEINNSHFVVERSTDARTFTVVGEVKGAGNSNSPLNYTFTDADAFGNATTLYYRLKQVDFDGAFAYSNLIAVTNTKENGNGVTIDAINPNPFTQDLKLTLNNVSEGDVTVEVFDLSGRKHYTQTQLTGQGTLTLDLSSLSTLSKGVYILNVRNAGTTLQQKLVKLQ